MKYQDQYNDWLDELYDTGIWNFSKLLEDITICIFLQVFNTQRYKKKA